MLLVLALGCLAGAGFLVAEVATQPAKLRRSAVARASTYGKIVLRRGDTRSFHDRALVPLAGRVAQTVLRLSPKTSVEAVTLKLLSAGMSLSATTFLAIKGCAATGGFVLGLIIGAGFGGVGAALALGLCFSALGYA